MRLYLRRRFGENEDANVDIDVDVEVDVDIEMDVNADGDGEGDLEPAEKTAHSFIHHQVAQQNSFPKSYP